MRYPQRVFRPFLRVARPDDWTGKLASAGTGLVLAVLVLSSLLARVPPDWVDAVGGQVILIRSLQVLVSVWMVVWLRAAVYSRLPAAAYLVGKRLVFPRRGRRKVVATDSIVAVHVERRPEPAGETFVVELRDGATHDVCPVHWEGAGRLYRGLLKKIA